MKKTRSSPFHRSFKLLLALVIIGGCFLFACSKRKDCCTVVNLTASFDVRGNDGTGVFDSSNFAFLNENSVQVLYLNKDGLYELVNRPNLDIPNGFFIDHEPGTQGYILRIEVNDYLMNDTSYTLLKLGQDNIKLKALVKKHQIQQLWWNDSILSHPENIYRIRINYPDK